MLHIVRLDIGPYYLADFNGRLATWTKDPQDAWEVRGILTTEALIKLLTTVFPSLQCFAQSPDTIIAATRTQEFKEPAITRKIWRKDGLSAGWV